MEKNTIDSPVRSIEPDLRAKPPEKGMALCLSGGGYRAMVFHLGAFWRLNEAGVLFKLKRLSSVSGGSITAAVLGMNWNNLRFHAQTGVGEGFESAVVQPVRSLASRTLDEWSIIGGALLPGTINEKLQAAYEKHLFHGKSLQDLPSDEVGPRIILNATNVQTGSLWRFSRPYMGDYQVGLIRHPRVPLAKAVAASSAFPPVLSPCALDVRPDSFDPGTRGSWWKAPFHDEIVLSDGGVYDNLGLETAYKRYQTILTSDAGQSMAKEAQPKGDWGRHGLRIIDLIDNQVRALRKRQLIHSYVEGRRSGTYWSVASHFEDYHVSDPLQVAGIDTSDLATLKTRLRSMEPRIQERLINWGYAICDAALRKHCVGVLATFGITLREPRSLPYPGIT